jgi:outer membrane protein, multidrug efflux system
MRPISHTILFAATAAFLAGCAVGPSYHKPATAVPDRFGELDTGGQPHEPGAVSAAAPDPETLSRWWTLFHDPELQSLVARALRNNRDLKAAVSRVREARAEREIVAGGLLPEVDATAGYNRSRGSKNVVIPFSALEGGGADPAAAGSASNSAAVGGSRLSPRLEDSGSGSSGTGAPAAGSQSAAIPPGGPSSPFGEGGLPGVTTNLYQAGFDAVWELDVFGGVRRAVEAADAEEAATREGEYGVRVTLMAEVATTYLQLRSSQQREEIARRNIDSQRATWKISQDKVDAGLGDAVEAAQELAQLRLDETALPPLVAAEKMSEHALALLLGEEPTALAAELSPPRALTVLPEDIPVGIPSDLLLRRPDIRQAERQVAAASAEIGEATAQLYPQFSLTGSFGIDSSDLKHLPEWSSRYYSIAPGISWPILDWAKLHAAIRVTNEEQTQALLTYQTAVSQALKEVEDALVQYGQEHRRRAALAEAVAQARRARDVTAQIYSQGLADQTATLQAERAVFQAEDELAQSDASLRTELVALYKALGGGWEVAKNQ